MNLKLCFISSWFPPTSIGGVERYLLNILEKLGRRGISSTVLTRYYPPLAKKDNLLYYFIRRIGLIPIPFSTKKYISTFLRIIDSYFNYSFIGYFQALKYIKEIDVINSQYGNRWDIILGNKLAVKMGKKHVVTFHGRFGYHSEDIYPSRKLFESLSKADFLIVNREQTFNFLLNKGFENIELMRNSISVSKYKKTNGYRGFDKYNKIKILFIGRLSYRRGAHLAIKSFLYAAKEYENIEMWIVGTGPLENKLKSLVENSLVKQRVKFFGKLFDIRKLLWNSHIFLATSPIANSPSLSLREAMASGLAIIATNVEETNQIIESNKNGIIVNPDIHSIKNGILKLVYDENLRKKISISAVEYAEKNFDIKKYIDRLVEIYKKI